MSVHYYETAVRVPADGDTVWIRMTPFSAAVSAIWRLATTSFELADGRIAPWYSVFRWRAA